MTKDILFSTDARQKIANGVDIIANAVKVTLGPKGRNAIIGNKFSYPVITKDGVSVARQVFVKDPFENLGVQMIKQVAAKSNDVAGDGTTTSTVLAQAIVNQSLAALSTTTNVMDLKRGIDLAVVEVVKELSRMSKPISAYEEIVQVATISANGDVEIGTKIAEVVQRVGPNSPITVEQSNKLGIEIDVIEGMRFDRGYLSSYFVNNTEKSLVELDNPYILLLDDSLLDLRSAIPFLEKVIKSGRSFLIICNDISNDLLSAFIYNKVKQGLSVAVVKSPEFGNFRKDALEDISILTGGELISSQTGTKLEEVELEQLGTAKRVIVGRDTTTIVDGKGLASTIELRCAKIKKDIEESQDEFAKSKMQERLAKLTSGIGVIRVGGATEVEIKEKKDRIDDAVSATRAAMQEGIVAGGGLSLLKASKVLRNDFATSNKDQNAGINIVWKALHAPFRQIVENAGLDGIEIQNGIPGEDDVNIGYNAQTNEYVDMFKAGIVDPTKVVRTALEGAASAAGLLITTEVAIVDNTDSEK